MDALKSKGQMLDQINLENIPRSGFDLSFNNKGTGKIGRIIPTRCMETLPGDSIKGSSQAALQFEPLAVPILSNMNVRQETWYVPNHILLDNWDTLISKGEDLSDNSSVPTFSIRRLWQLLCNSEDNSNYSIWKYFDNLEDPTAFWALSCPYTKDDEGNYNSNHSIYLNVDYLFQSLRAFLALYQDDSQFYSEQVQDILLYRVSVVKEFLNLLNDLNSTYGQDLYDSAFSSEPLCRGIDLFFNANTNTVIKSHIALPFYQDGEYFYGQYYDKLSEADKKLQKLFSSISSNADGFYVLSDFGNALCQFIYDMVAPIFGSSSLLDYMSYPTLSLVDVTYLFHRTLYSKIKLTDNTDFESYYEKISEFVGDMSAFIVSSEYSILPLRAYYAIWYNNYRDKLLETLCPEPSSLTTISDRELFHLCLLRVRCWSKDTFNTALANTGTGNMVVPISQNLSGGRTYLDGFSSSSDEKMLDLNLTEYVLDDGTKIQLPSRYLTSQHSYTKIENGVQYEFSLDTLRRAGRTEKWIQKALIYGNLIQDSLYTHWGVKIKNERIQLPEFVTSSSQLVQINTLVNNTTTAESVAGDKSAFASAYDNGGQFDFYSPENGYLVSFMSILPEQTYAYGLPRHLSKLRIFDFAFPEFAQIGMDAVYNQEIRSQATILDDSYLEVFGYQGRYYDYKCKQDEEHGELRTTQDMYTFARDFNIYDPLSRPQLNYIFVHCWPSLDMFVTDDPLADLFRFDIHHSVAASRALPVCGLSV